MGVASELIRSLEVDERPIQGAGSKHDEFEEGDKVEALYKGKGTKWFSGVVKRVNRDGTYEIRYDDGDNEVILNNLSNILHYSQNISQI